MIKAPKRRPTCCIGQFENFQQISDSDPPLIDATPQDCHNLCRNHLFPLSFDRETHLRTLPDISEFI